MAKLRFTFGTMGSGKSTQALQIHHNLRARGLTTLLMTQLDRREGRVQPRGSTYAGPRTRTLCLTTLPFCAGYVGMRVAPFCAQEFSERAEPCL